MWQAMECRDGNCVGQGCTRCRGMQVICMRCYRAPGACRCDVTTSVRERLGAEVLSLLEEI